MEVFGDLGGEDGGGGEVVDVFEAFVAEPEEVEADLVAGDELVVGVPLEAVGLLALVAVAGLVGGYEVVEVGPGQGVLLEGEVLVGAEVVDPQPLCPGFLCAWPAADSARS